MSAAQHELWAAWKRELDLVATLEAVTALHARYRNIDEDGCVSCGPGWPCATWRVLTRKEVVVQADSEQRKSVRVLTAGEVKEVTVTRIKTAFHDVDVDESELQRRAEWVVDGMEKWGVMVVAVDLDFTEPGSSDA